MWVTLSVRTGRPRDWLPHALRRGQVERDAGDRAHVDHPADIAIRPDHGVHLLPRHHFQCVPVTQARQVLGILLEPFRWRALVARSQ